VRISTLVILGLPLGCLRTKSHLDVSLVKRHKVYYKGEGGSFSQVWIVMSLGSSSLLMVCPSIKSASIM
jgi:hypothetical protein